MEELIQLLEQIQELAGVAIDALSGLGGEAPTEGAPPAEGAPPEEMPPGM